MKQLLLLITISIFATTCKQTSNKQPIVVPQEVITKPILEYGYNMDNFHITNDTIKRNETLGIILDRHHITQPNIHRIVTQIKDSFDLRKLKVGKPYTILSKKDTTQQAQVFIYKPNATTYSIIDFKDSVAHANNFTRDIITKLETASGVITSSLFETLESQELDEVLALELADIYAWTIDFYRIYKDDKFKVIYEQKYIKDSIPVGIGRIHAAYFEHHNTPFYAFNYIADSISGSSEYFDDESRNLRKAFLKSPIKFGRISSRYSMSRYVKIYGRRKPHLGTDFAAPVGTPIMSTANGVVTKASYTRGNGKYVKVKHNSTYSTQYLHMSKRAVKVGDVVKQGQTIGYIGMTGSTSGPHVCYRFWKNRKQVDALRQVLPAVKPMADTIKPYYFEFIKPLRLQLDSITYPLQVEKDTVKSLDYTVRN